MSEKIVESAERDDGGLVFPELLKAGEVAKSVGGLSLRDWFAGQALISIADDCGMADAEIAERCYARADAMIEHRAALFAASVEQGRYPLDEKLAAVKAYVKANGSCRPAAMEQALIAAAAVREERS